jgi:D-alanyl-lipoteichoic acid acyltransferase DltB (MBOAT superfamily)
VIFHSLDFLLFLAIVLVGYWSLPRRGQNALLLVGSYVFYGWIHPWFLILIATSTVVDYLAAQGMARRPERKRLFLVASLATNLGMLGFFKYWGFFVSNVTALLESAGLPSFTGTLDIFLPVGISFYTFQTLSYTIDVYRGRLEPRRDLLDFAVFVSFFPQLVAGPIERAVTFLPQVESPRSTDPERVRSALLLMLWGFFKKLCVADQVAVIANRVFTLEAPGFFLLWVGVLAFCVQIYADFSAYTDIARGTARLLGFELMQNFDHPYVSRTPQEFWRRWHISLSSWFRDYVYIPLGGSRCPPRREMLNLTSTFLLSGLWHGASWNFVLWGGYHGALLVLYRLGARLLPNAARIGWLSVPRWLLFFGLTNLGWLVFRETDTSQLLQYLGTAPWETTRDQAVAAAYLLVQVLFWTLPIIVHTLLYVRGATWETWTARPGRVLVHNLAGALLLVAIFTLRAESTVDFIYFQF